MAVKVNQRSENQRVGLDVRVGGTGLQLLHKREAVPRRARSSGSWTCVSLNCSKEEEEYLFGRGEEAALDEGVDEEVNPRVLTRTSSDSSQFENKYFAAIWSGSEKGS